MRCQGFGICAQHLAAVFKLDDKGYVVWTKAQRSYTSVEGVFAAPEGAAALVAYRKLRASGFFRAEDKVVLFNTGSAYKYLDMIEAQEKKARPEPPAARSIGGIIGPY